MHNLLTPQQLIDFESDIAECFNSAQIKAPVHLYDGNENQIIEIFKKVQPNDWIFCSWRSHYQCLLKGVPPEQLKKDILLTGQTEDYYWSNAWDTYISSPTNESNTKYVKNALTSLIRYMIELPEYQLS